VQANARLLARAALANLLPSICPAPVRPAGAADPVWTCVTRLTPEPAAGGGSGVRGPGEGPGLVEEVVVSVAEAAARDGCPPGSAAVPRSAASWGGSGAAGEARFRWCVYCVGGVAGVWLMLDDAVAAGCHTPLCAVALPQVPLPAVPCAPALAGSDTPPAGPAARTRTARHAFTCARARDAVSPLGVRGFGPGRALPRGPGVRVGDGPPSGHALAPRAVHAVRRCAY
jgi:hypothetical protein